MIRRVRPNHILLGLAIIAIAGPALAQDHNARTDVRILRKAQLNATECTCRLKGQSLPVGTEVCMGDGMFRCQMEQNVTSWKSLASPCPLS